jgi:hypothetical protein
MLSKNLTRILILLITSMIFWGTSPLIVRAQQTRMYVDPPTIQGLQVGDTFQVNITAADVTDLWAWQFTLYYKNAVLNATSLLEGPFLKTHPDPSATTLFVIANFTDTYSDTYGQIIVACSLVAVHGGVNGTGTLATIGFRVKAEGSSPLTLSETKLVDSAEPFGNLMPHTDTNGNVFVGVHDIAVTNVNTSKTIAGGTIVYINVTVENHGQVVETFNVTAYYNQTTAIDTELVTNLAISGSTVVTLSFDTSTVPKGIYAISATAGPILGESSTADNTYTDGTVQKAMLGDLNGDGRVNILDISIVAAAFNTRPGDQKWNPNADIDNNAVVNIVDITKVAKEYGKIDP